jgi:hypothetical protein
MRQANARQTSLTGSGIPRRTRDPRCPVVRRVLDPPACSGEWIIRPARRRRRRIRARLTEHISPRRSPSPPSLSNALTGRGDGGQLDMPQVRGSLSWVAGAPVAPRRSPPPSHRSGAAPPCGGCYRWRPLSGPVLPMVATKRRGRRRPSTLAARELTDDHPLPGRRSRPPARRSKARTEGPTVSRERTQLGTTERPRRGRTFPPPSGRHVHGSSPSLAAPLLVPSRQALPRVGHEVIDPFGTSGSPSSHTIDAQESSVI